MEGLMHHVHIVWTINKEEPLKVSRKMTRSELHHSDGCFPLLEYKLDEDKKHLVDTHRYLLNEGISIGGRRDGPRLKAGKLWQ